MIDQYSHKDGTVGPTATVGQCRPVGVDPNAGLFTDAEAPAIAPPAAKPPFTAEQQATLDRLAREPSALLLVNAARWEAVTKYGHTDASDSQRAMLAMPHKAREWIGDANEALRDTRLSEAERIKAATRKYAKAAALILSQIDRLDFELAVLNVERGNA